MLLQSWLSDDIKLKNCWKKAIHLVSVEHHWMLLPSRTNFIDTQNLRVRTNLGGN